LAGRDEKSRGKTRCDSINSLIDGMEKIGAVKGIHQSIGLMRDAGCNNVELLN
jgi:hypothetical protein